MPLTVSETEAKIDVLAQDHARCKYHSTDLNIRLSDSEFHGYFHETSLSSNYLRNIIAIKLPRVTFDSLTTTSWALQTTRAKSCTGSETEAQLNDSPDFPQVCSPYFPANLLKGTSFRCKESSGCQLIMRWIKGRFSMVNFGRTKFFIHS